MSAVKPAEPAAPATASGARPASTPENMLMSALRFFRVDDRKPSPWLLTGPWRCQLWERRDSYQPRLKWGAAILRVVSELGARRMTEDRYFQSREPAIAWLEKERTGIGAHHLYR